MSRDNKSILVELLTAQTLQAPLTQALQEISRKTSALQRDMERVQLGLNVVQNLNLAEQLSEIWRVQARSEHQLQELRKSYLSSTIELQRINTQEDAQENGANNLIDFLLMLDERLRLHETNYLQNSAHRGIRAWIYDTSTPKHLNIGADEDGSIVGYNTIICLTQNIAFTNNIESLDMSNDQTNADSNLGILIRSISPQNNIKSLNISNSCITNESFTNILINDPFPRLHTIYATNCQSINMQRLLSELYHAPLGQRIQRLHMRGNGLTNSDRQQALERMGALQLMEI